MEFNSIIPHLSHCKIIFSDIWCMGGICGDLYECGMDIYAKKGIDNGLNVW